MKSNFFVWIKLRLFLFNKLYCKGVGDLEQFNQQMSI